jgi:hypothetical protein
VRAKEYFLSSGSTFLIIDNHPEEFFIGVLSNVLFFDLNPELILFHIQFRLFLEAVLIRNVEEFLINLRGLK